MKDTDITLEDLKSYNKIQDKAWCVMSEMNTDKSIQTLKYIEVIFDKNGVNESDFIRIGYKKIGDKNKMYGFWIDVDIFLKPIEEIKEWLLKNP